jgi:hypothetical protein
MKPSRATWCGSSALCLVLTAGCTATPVETPLASRSPGARIAVAIIDDGSVAEESSWLDNYNVVQPEHGTPSDHTAQVVSVVVGAGLSDALDSDAVGISVLPVSLSTQNQDGQLVARLDEALLNGADVVLVTVGARHDQAGICDRVDALAADGAIVIAAAGNFPSLGADYPARCDSAVSIGALDAPGVFASYSTRRQVEFGMVVKGIKATDLSGDVSEPGGTSIAAAAAARTIIRELIERGTLMDEQLLLLLEPLPNHTDN